MMSFMTTAVVPTPPPAPPIKENPVPIEYDAGGAPESKKKLQEQRTVFSVH
jgi:hypothetical protein